LKSFGYTVIQNWWIW